VDQLEIATLIIGYSAHALFTQLPPFVRGSILRQGHIFMVGNKKRENSPKSRFGMAIYGTLTLEELVNKIALAGIEFVV